MSRLSPARYNSASSLTLSGHSLGAASIQSRIFGVAASAVFAAGAVFLPSPSLADIKGKKLIEAAEGSRADIGRNGSDIAILAAEGPLQILKGKKRFVLINDSNEVKLAKEKIIVEEVQLMKVSPDGNSVVAVIPSGEILLFDVKNRKKAEEAKVLAIKDLLPKREPPTNVQTGGIVDVHFSPNGKALYVSIGYNERISDNVILNTQVRTELVRYDLKKGVSKGILSRLGEPGESHVRPGDSHVKWQRLDVDFVTTNEKFILAHEMPWRASFTNAQFGPGENQGDEGRLIRIDVSTGEIFEFTSMAQINESRPKLDNDAPEMETRGLLGLSLSADGKDAVYYRYSEHSNGLDFVGEIVQSSGAVEKVLSCANDHPRIWELGEFERGGVTASADGKFAAFKAYMREDKPELVIDDERFFTTVGVIDLSTRQCAFAEMTVGQDLSPLISANGKRVVFESQGVFGSFATKDALKASKKNWNVGKVVLK